MPPANRRRRNNRRNAISRRVPAASNQSPDAPESIPRSIVANDESNTENQRDNFPLQSITFHGSLNASNSGNDCNSTNSDATNNSTTAVSTNRGQRDLLIDLLNNSKVDCVICQECITNDEHMWSCRCCYQLMHLKCIMVWVIKSHTNFSWRCPACQTNLVGKPTYVCFCGSLRNPFSNNMNTPHSCGKVCRLQKKNTNSDFGNCQHLCTLRCHPGPCPQCVIKVYRYCGCGKTNAHVQCGQSTPVLCQNKCSKLLDCKSHICEKKCHAGKCGPCKESCTQGPQNILSHRSPQQTNLTNFPAREDFEEELRMLGLDPVEVFQGNTNLDMFFSDGSDDSDEYVSGDDDLDGNVYNRNDLRELRAWNRMEEHMYAQEPNDRFRRYSYAVNAQMSNHRDIVENGLVTSNDSSISSMVSVTNASNSSNITHYSRGYNLRSSHFSFSMSTSSSSEDIDIVCGHSANSHSA